MKKIVALTSALVASVLLPAGPTSAGAVPVYTELPPGFSEYSSSCSGGDDPDGLLEFVHGPAPTPFGTGSLRLYAGPDHQAALFQDVDSLGSVTAWNLRVRPSAGNTPFLLAVVQTDSDIYQLSAPVDSSSDAWTQVDGYTLPMQVYSQQQADVVGTSSIQDWSSMGLGDGPAQISVFDVPCIVGLPSGSVYVDGWVSGTTGQGTSAYDFEEGDVATLTNKVSADSIVKGRSVKLSTKAQLGDQLLFGRPVTLWAKPKGAAKFQKVGTAVTNGKGAASLTKKPRKTTTYQWRYAGHASPSKKVTVKPAG